MIITTGRGQRAVNGNPVSHEELKRALDQLRTFARMGVAEVGKVHRAGGVTKRHFKLIGAAFDIVSPDGSTHFCS